MRKKGEEKGLDPNGWMVTFSDLLNLLLTFFVLLISMSAMDQQKIKEAFANFGTGAGMRVGLSTERPTVFESPQARVKQRLILQLMNMESVEEPDKTDIPDSLKGLVQVKIKDNEVVLVIADSILFKPGSTQPTEMAKRIIKAVSPVIKDLGSPVEVRGFTDNRPAAQPLGNWDISIKRAVSIVRLLEESGVDPTLLSAAGFAHLNPIADNFTASGRAKNRRVEIAIKVSEEDNG